LTKLGDSSRRDPQKDVTALCDTRTAEDAYPSIPMQLSKIVMSGTL